MADTHLTLKTDELLLNMGPQHPSTHGVLRLLLKTDGEIVHEAIPYIGYLHRCFEKHAENIPFNEVVPYTDRMDYIAAMNNNFGYAVAMEALLGITVPERVEYIRVIMAELNRIASHLLALGTYGLDLGAVTPFLWCFRDREMILDLFEMTCGARLLYNYIWIGGLSHDLPDGFVRKATDFCHYFEPKIDELNELLSFNDIFVQRTANIGVLSKEMAIDYGVTGPNLRGSGVAWDLRKHDPYSIYDRFEFDIPVGRGDKGTVGDCWDRYMVRVWEMEQSRRILLQALKNVPEGDVHETVPKVIKPKAGEVYRRTETPRGDLGYYIVADGGRNPYRVKVRAPAFTALSVMPELCRGVMIADLVSILGSIDIVLGEVDR